MVSYQYTYIIADIILLAVWLVLFSFRKDLRREMLVFSLLFAFLAPFVEAVHISDWWRPLTITNTSIGIEDILFGFGIAGIAAVIYPALFNKKLKIKNIRAAKADRNFLGIITLFLLIFFGGFFIFNLNSFIAAICSLTIPTLIIYIRRHDLIKDSLISGILLLAFSIVGYSLLNLITPGFFEEFWLFENIGRIMILGIPLEEHTWFFLFGSFIGPLYQYSKEAKLININN